MYLLTLCCISYLHSLVECTFTYSRDQQINEHKESNTFKIDGCLIQTNPKALVTVLVYIPTYGVQSPIVGPL